MFPNPENLDLTPPSVLAAIELETIEHGFDMASVDDLRPQDSWPEGHAARVPVFIEELRSMPDLEVEYREWFSGILLARKRNRSAQSERPCASR